MSENSEKRPVLSIGQEDSILSPVSEFLKITDRNALFFISESTGEIIYISPLFKKLSGITDENRDITIKHLPEFLQKTSETDKITSGEFVFKNQAIASNTYSCSVFTIAESYSCYTFTPVQAENRQDPGPDTEKKLKLALESGRMGMWEWCMHTAKIYWSRETEEIFGLREGSFDGKMESYFSMIFADDQAVVRQKIENALSTRSRFEVEHRITKPDQSMAWVLCRGNIVENELGETTGMAGIILDISEKKTIEQNLLQSEERFRIIAEQTGQLIYDYCLTTGKITWSGAIEKITGYPEKEFRVTGFTEWELMIHPEDRNFAMEELEKAMSSVSDFSVVYRFRHKNGNYFYVYDKGIFLKDESGKAWRMLGAMRDLTDQISAEEKVRKIEMRYRNLIENLQVGIMVQAPDSTILVANETASRIFHSTPETVKGSKSSGTNDWKVCDENGVILRDDQRPLVRTLKTGQAVENLITGIQKSDDHPLTWLMVSSHPQKDDAGNIREVITTFIDITSQRNFEKALKKIAIGVSATTGENFFSKLVQYISATLEVEFAQVATFNEDKSSLITLSEFTTSTTAAEDIRNIINSPYQDLLVKPLVYYPEKIRDFFPDDTLLNDAKLECFLGITLCDSDEKPIGVLSVMSKNSLKDPDIATYLLQVFAARAAAELERLNAEKEKSELIEKLIEQNKELQDFSYVLSHSVRAPVATMLGLTSLFDKVNPGNSFNTELIRNIEKVTSNLDSVIKDLSKSLSLRNLAEFHEEITLSEVLKRIRQQLSSQIAGKNVTIHADFQEAPLFYSIKKYVVNILLSLVDNAIKFSSPQREPLIEIKSIYIDNYIQITIRDNGLGIDLNKHKDQIFNMYKRFHLFPEGKGLGLYFVKTQINALHGKIELHSKVNEGTEVKIYLPFQEEFETA